MRSLHVYLNENLINEAVLKDEEDILAAIETNSELKKLHDFFAKNYDSSSFMNVWDENTQEYQPSNLLRNEKIDVNKKIISCGGGRYRYCIKVKPTATKLLPDGWIFGTIGKDFDISDSNIADLSQAPTKISGNFYMNNCDNITSFAGNLQSVGVNLYCKDCKNLTSSEGQPAVKGKIVSTNSPLSDTNSNASNALSKPSRGANNHSTLYDAVAPFIKNFAFKRTSGPSHYDDIVALDKVIKSKYKTVPLKSVLGNKANPAMLANIFAGIASQVEVDYSLDVKDRIEDANNKFKKVYNDIVKQEKIDITSGLYFYFETDPVVKRYIHGTKQFATKNGVGLVIHVEYETGEQIINIMDSSILFK